MKSDPVRGYQEKILQQRDTPAHDDNSGQRQFVEPFLSLKPQLAIPGKSHKYIGHDQ